jgi:hypothetical protein
MEISFFGGMDEHGLTGYKKLKKPIICGNL